MEALTVALLPAGARPLLEGRLPEVLEAHWWEDGDQLVELAPLAEIGWFDMFDKQAPLKAIARAERLRWLNTAFAGVDWLPLADLQRRGAVLTNGSGLNANAVAEFAVMAMLNVARGYREIVQAQERQEWLGNAPANRELAGSRALLFGYGAIGQAIARILHGFGVEIVPVRRNGGEGALGPGEWRERIGSFDWVVLAVPGTPKTAGLLDAAAIAAMKNDAVLVNVARADVLDQDALIEALRQKRIAAAVLDLTDPEPLPPGHRLWSLENAHVTMHLAGMPTVASRARAAERFAVNCGRYLRGEQLVAEVNLAQGY